MTDSEVGTVKRFGIAILLMSTIFLLSLGCTDQTEPAVAEAPPMTVATASPDPVPSPTYTPELAAMPTAVPANEPAQTSTPPPTPRPSPTRTPPLTPTPPPTPAPSPTPTPPSTPAPPGPDRATLVAFYTATDGPNWSRNTNWLSEEPLDRWYGVTTDDKGRVVGLYLAVNGLNGTIPAVLGKMAGLGALDLGQNELAGVIPTELGELGNLERLDLADNLLTGSIPSELGDLAKLTQLELAGNFISGPVPDSLGNLAGLTNLGLDHNRLSGSIPAALGDLSNLEGLRLEVNEFSGDIPASLGRLSHLTRMSLSHNRLTGKIPAALGGLANLQLIRFDGNRLEGCVPSELFNVKNSDLASLSLSDCASSAVTPRPNHQQAPELRPNVLGALFDEIIKKTERREAFSEVKEQNLQFSALEDMKKLRSEFINVQTEEELYYALWKLSNARRDTHLVVGTVDGGLEIPERPGCVSAPIHVLPDYSDIHDPTFFVAAVRGGLTSPQRGEVIVAINGQSTAEYVTELAHWIRHSTLHGLYWHVAFELPKKYFIHPIPPSVYSERLNLTLEGPSGKRYDVSLPYRNGCWGFDLVDNYPGFVEVMTRTNFNVLLDRSRHLILLQWLDFERDDLIKDIPALMEFAEREEILDYDMIIDVSRSSGGSSGAYAIQRLVDLPFRTTFGNVRLSDLGKQRINRYRGRRADEDAPNIFGLNLSRSWLYHWARTDATDAIDRGDEYTAPVPFKLAHLSKDSDGILQPAPVHFSGRVAIINGGVWGGSHLDQFVAMFVDNDLATFVGMPTGGYSNTWEGDEVLRFRDKSRPVVEFQWSIGHTIRPNGEVLEGNPAQPDIYIPLTRQNFLEYRKILFDQAIAALAR